MFKRRLKIFLVAFGLMLSLLFLTNPDESDYLDEIKDNYGEFHNGLSMSQDDLLKMGEGKRVSFLFFSTYKYTFGTISVRYIGILAKEYFIGSSWEDPKKEKEKEAITLL